MRTPLRVWPAAAGPDVATNAAGRSVWEPGPERARADLTGVVLGERFELMGRLGEGGMASLYLALDRLNRCRVAVKILRDDIRDLRQRFLREAEILSNVHHEHVIHAVYRGQAANGLPYMVLPFLPGQDLAARLREGPLPWATVVEIGIQIADALRCIHAAGIIHRDVKPENIMWTDHVSRPVFVKLIDLGAAKASSHFQGQQDQTFTPVGKHRPTAIGEALGTPGYMPPEAGFVAPDERTDVFALGVTLYQLCTGQLPHSDPLTPTPMRVARPDCDAPEDLERVLFAAIHFDLDQRTPSMKRVHQELLAIRAARHTEEDGGGVFAGRLELREHLATGAEAEVFHAYHRKLRRPVALKRLLETLEANPEVLARFEREAWVLAALRHPGLPEVYDSGTASGRAYTVMELCRGEPARRLCEDGRRLGWREVLAVGVQVARALQAVHAIGVIHRALDVEHVLIEPGPPPRVKVIDFTASLPTPRFFDLRDEPHATGDHEQGASREPALHLLPCAAPEVRSEQRWSERSDVYALGVLLVRLLTGRAPDGEPLRGALPASGERVLAALLEPDPAQRTTDMAAVAEALAAVLAEAG